VAPHPPRDKFVTVIIDLTPVRDGTGPSRLLDMVEGRSKQVFKTWLEAQTPAFRDGIKIVAMDGFTGFKTAAAEEIPDTVAVMDPFHVVALPARRWTDAANASSRTPAAPRPGR
jgi:transposase